MKKLILLLIAMMFVAGCQAFKYVKETYDPNTQNLTSRETLYVAQAMVTADINDMLFMLDKNKWFAWGSISTIYDGNDWEHIGNAVATGRTGGLNKLIKLK